jgi:hypothetical protein
MNSSLTKLIKYLVYGVIISLLICVIPNKQPNKGENIMVVMVAVGSLALLDNLCPNKKNKENMTNTGSIQLPIDMDVYYVPKKENKQKPKEIDLNTTEDEGSLSEYNNQEEDDTEIMEEDDTEIMEEDDNEIMEEEYNEIMEEQEEEKEIDVKLEEELGCDCTDEIKKIRLMFKSELIKMKKQNVKRENKILDNLEKYKKKYSKEKSKNLDNVVVNNKDDENIYNNTSLDLTGNNEWYYAVELAKETLNIKKKSLSKKQKIKVIKKATEILIRKEIMKSMGIIDSSFNNLPASTRKKINRMTNKALSLEDLIISKLNFSNNVPKIIRKNNTNDDNKEKSSYYEDNNDNNWNEMKYSDINPQLYKPLGDSSKDFGKKWDKGWTKDGGYVYLNTDKWKVPTKRPPICLTNSKCNVCPSNTNGYPADLMSWREADDINTGPNINLKYAKNKLNKYLKPGEKVLKSN